MRTVVHDLAEVLAKVHRCRESRRLRNTVDRLIADLQQPLSELDQVGFTAGFALGEFHQPASEAGPLLVRVDGDNPSPLCPVRAG